ncbi:hypothetical protein ACO1O0_009101 [Amphichorda felina]
MFEVSQAKRVRREDLNELYDSGSSDSEADAQLRAQLQAQIARSLALDFTDATDQHHLSRNATASGQQPVIKDEWEEAGEEAGPEEYDFCLFGGADAASTKVVLEDHDGPQGEGGLVMGRPLSYYLPTLSQEQRLKLKVAAVSGDEVLAQSQWRRWGMELPWKVTHITTKKKAGSSDQVGSEEDPDMPAKRKRPGKKRRIALRMKERAKKEKAGEAAKQQEEKEEHLKEKKKRLNRAKKLRRREKEREKKLGAGGEDAVNAGGESDGSD